MLFSSLSLFGQIDTDLVISDLQNKISSKWVLKIDTTHSDSLVSPSLIKSGTFNGFVTLAYKDLHTIEFFLFYSENDSVFTYEIGNYLNHASCALSKKHQAKNYYYKIDNYYLFLPMYPCWTPGYSKKSKKQILKLFGKAERKRVTIRERK